MDSVQTGKVTLKKWTDMMDVLYLGLDAKNNDDIVALKEIEW